MGEKLLHTQFDELTGLVTEKCINEIKDKVMNFTIHQRRHLTITNETVFLVLPANLKIETKEDGKKFNII